MNEYVFGVYPERKRRNADFYPFGGERAYTNSCQQNYKFTGKERDPESGLDNFEARYYGSSIARFTSPDDPFVGWNLADPQSLNLYAYVQDNPINDVDPTGHMTAVCFTAGFKQLSNTIGMGPGCAFTTNLMDPGDAAVWCGTACITEADRGDPIGFGRANTIQADENVHLGNVADTLALAAIQKQLKQMSLSSQGLDFIKRHETFGGKPSLTPYKDIAGNPTIGYGHKVAPGEDFSKGISPAQALALLNQDAQTAVDAVNKYATAPLSQNQFDALADFTFNEGATRFANSTLRATIVEGETVSEHDFTEYHFSGHNPSSGLLNRRIDEYNLYSNGDYGGGP